MNSKKQDSFFLSEKFLSKLPILILISIFVVPVFLLHFSYKIGLYFIAFYVSYWTIKAFESYIYILSAYIKLLRIHKKDFLNTNIIKNEAKSLKFVVILPYISTPLDVIEDTIESILKSDYIHMENLTIILAPEDRDKVTLDNVYKAYEEYKNSKPKIIVIPHIMQLGDGKVKGANITYGIKQYLKQYNPDENNTVVITTDGDAKIEKNLFTILAHTFLTTEMPHNAIYQFTPVYSNNWSKGTFFARLIAMGTTFWQLTESQNPEFYRCFSTYSMSLKCLIKSDFWSRTSIVEDGFQYWKSYFAWDGIFRIVNVPAVVKMDVVEEVNLWKTIKSQYKQLRRWSWGCSDVEFVIPEFVKNKKIPLIEKIRKTVYLVLNHAFWAGGSLMLFVIGYFPGVFDNLRNSIATLAVPLSISIIFTWIFSTIAFPSVVSTLIMKKYAHFRKRDYIFNVLQWITIPFLTLTLFSFPAIESQIRLFFNKRIDEFQATEKMTRKK